MVAHAISPRGLDDELLLEIGFLLPQKHRATMAAVSRHFHRVFMECLYRDPNPFAMKALSSRNETLGPHPASYVRNLTLRNHGEETPEAFHEQILQIFANIQAHAPKNVYLKSLSICGHRTVSLNALFPGDIPPFLRSL